MFSKINRILWGDLSSYDLKKFGILSCIITIILGNYWMLRVLKNPIFDDLVGLEYQPYAKMASIFVVALIVMIYSKLVDITTKKRLFDIVCGFYAVMFCLLCVASLYPENFSLQDSNILYPLFTWIPGKFVGWLSYFVFESSSIMIIIFWAFVASVTTPDSAKKGYPMIVSCTQIGTITGSAVVAKFAPIIGAPIIIGMGGLVTLSIPILIRYYLQAVPNDDSVSVQTKNYSSKKNKTGFLEGLRLIIAKPYVTGILVVSTVYEIVATILEFQMNMLAKGVFPSRDLYASFTGTYGMSINCLALVFALLGTSFFMRRFGFRFCLLAYPLTVGILLSGLLGCKMIAITNINLMWVLFAAMVAIKGFSYALNNPTKEVMYIPTTDDIRFKAKGWIESFGGRTSKGTGAIVTASFAKNLSGLLLYGTIISLGVVGIWLLVANFLGKKFNQMQSERTVVQ